MLGGGRIRAMTEIERIRVIRRARGMIQSGVKRGWPVPVPIPLFFNAEFAERSAECTETGLSPGLTSFFEQNFLCALCAPLCELCVEKIKLEPGQIRPARPSSTGHKHNESAARPARIHVR
jgi:hypothetical protein